MNDNEAQIELLKRLLFQAQDAANGLNKQVEIYETALEQIAWSNDSKWQQDCAKQALEQTR